MTSAAIAGGVKECASCGCREDDEGYAVGYDDDEVFNHASFSRLLRKASLGEAREYSMMSYLCNITYMIPRIQPKCLRRYNLQFVTSSVQDKAGASPDQKQERSTKKDKSGDQ
ncbi:phospholipase A1 PLIP1, chloroplastic [Zea mays]|uniref:phospholipase A1 PLIP1, chloroplastic n=1 Tax=Zea mays TaxID=4577 RepID=UPI0009A9DD9C|nr:phospholipase A1 PLIP1, chloroplastic-like [Zea mays]|eukprot:XP_020393253.1 uncharacterized protein LOC109939482 [Zea mays]